MIPFALPADYSRIQRVESFAELISTRFADGVNALCWPRLLPGDFNEVVGCLDVSQGITTLEESRLAVLPLSPAGRGAVDLLLADQRLLRASGLEPVLDCINGYAPHEQRGPVRTDVCSFHVDTATDVMDTYLCTYFGPSSEGLRNDEARRHVDIPATRAELLKLFAGGDNDLFRDFLSENCYDLHYAPQPSAQPFSFGVGNLWRIAVDYPGSPVPPCIHRAPDPIPGQPPRLLLIS